MQQIYRTQPMISGSSQKALDNDADLSKEAIPSSSSTQQNSPRRERNLSENNAIKGTPFYQNQRNIDRLAVYTTRKKGQMPKDTYMHIRSIKRSSPFLLCKTLAFQPPCVCRAEANLLTGGGEYILLEFAWMLAIVGRENYQ